MTLHAEALVYLDYNATTPVDSSVVDSMTPWFTERFWNPASAHPAGRRAAEAVEQARARVAALLGARAREIVFTAGATEANNIAMKGVVEAAVPSRDRVVVAATEHKAVLDTAMWLADHGADVSVVPVRSSGEVDIDAYRAAVNDRTTLVSVMAANNETGVLADLRPLSDIAHEAGAVFHTDATQAVGRVPFDVVDAGVDLASLSGHKIYGPKGIGALYVNRKVRIAPLMHGGSHEGGIRSGTLNVPGVVGLGAASDLAVAAMSADSRRFRSLIDMLTRLLVARIPDTTVVGQSAARLPNTLNVRFTGADAEAVMANACGVAVSSGSACTSMVPTASHVLLAMGLDHLAAQECLRFSVGRPTTENEVQAAALEIGAAVARVRALGG